MKRAAALLASAALLVGGALAVGAAPASAAVAPRMEGTFPITLNGCHISEQIELQGSPEHDYMRWETTSNSAGCYVWFIRNGATYDPRYVDASGTDGSDWYYDGPGYTMQVCVEAPSGAQACGPEN